MSEKLQKVLARAGLGSRRQMEDWIAQGRVRVNGQVAGLGDRIGPDVRITVDGKPISSRRLVPPPPQVLLYYKPIGEVSTRSDPEGRPTVYQKLPREKGVRWVAVGRLDVNTSGLLLFTTDGELASRLMHPSYGIQREYAVRVFGEVTPEILQSLHEGVELEDGPARFESISASQPMSAEGEDEDSANQWFRVTLAEGRKREVRRLWESQGLRVSRLIRLRYGPVELPRNMRRGDLKPMPPRQMLGLYQLVGLRRDDLPDVRGHRPRPGARPARGKRPAPGKPRRRG
ncbi:23S rRNA pseudouridine(2605) synthase RluB [Alkalilimnicola sp. S0819]|uniref:23S rRNA pseudouridine(2605) synthase RluB n=1 Tax=Alkalilimnicola sp. S0819 TaxID=2613922 RepID=UPI0012616B30|nr:pseudouridine synthase [Alkalilimnicola sp. S0819]KAB7619633.1 pseudouridine synthase [Alkalilimnicola sp. S0819]MPQ17570.1 pseudouridine synthase [Alkalilimnicola sp. S0819]